MEKIVFEGFKWLKGPTPEWVNPKTVDCDILHLPAIYRYAKDIENHKKVRITIEEIE